MNRNLKMNAEIELEFLEPLADDTELSFDIGTLEFLINQKCVSVEFDRIDSRCEIAGNIAKVQLEAGYAANNYKESRIESDKAFRESGPSAEDLTSKFISKATQINVFDVWPLIGQEELDADEFKMTILKIAFSDGFGSHPIAQAPINAFNEAFNH